MRRLSYKQISRLEDAVSTLYDEERAKYKERLGRLRQAALCHATCVSAIILAGKPEIDEPLSCAWERTLQHYGIKVKDPMHFEGQVAAARWLRWKILGKEDPKTRLTEIFEPAPGWLLHFTRIVLGSLLLDFLVPTLSEKANWGIDGIRDSRRWPALPTGMMGAGSNSIPKDDIRTLMELGSLSAVMRVRTKRMQDQDPYYKQVLFPEDPYEMVLPDVPTGWPSSGWELIRHLLEWTGEQRPQSVGETGLEALHRCR